VPSRVRVTPVVIFAYSYNNDNNNNNKRWWRTHALIIIIIVFSYCCVTAVNFVCTILLLLLILYYSLRRAFYIDCTLMQVTHILAAAAARPWILINVRRASVSVVVVPIVSREYVPVILFSSRLSEKRRSLFSRTPFPPSLFSSRHRFTLHYTWVVGLFLSTYVFK